MSIGDFVNGCTLLLGSRMYHPAMCLAMNVLDATAQREYPNWRGRRHVTKRCLQFVRDHYDIITVVGTGGAIYSAPGSKLILPESKAGKTSSLEDILYFSVRNQLTHEAELPTDTFFNEQAVFGKTAQGFSIPVNLIYAVILAVVGAKTNSHETSDSNIGLTVMGKAVPIAECWGNKDKVLSLLGIGSRP